VAVLGVAVAADDDDGDGAGALAVVDLGGEAAPAAQDDGDPALDGLGVEERRVGAEGDRVHELPVERAAVDVVAEAEGGGVEAFAHPGDGEADFGRDFLVWRVSEDRRLGAVADALRSVVKDHVPLILGCQESLTTWLVIRKVTFELVAVFEKEAPLAVKILISELSVVSHRG
jgi:hypothetical protein